MFSNRKVCVGPQLSTHHSLYYLFSVGLNAEKLKELFALIFLRLEFESRFGEEDDDSDESSTLSVEPPLSLILSLKDRASGPEDMYSGNTLQRKVFDLEAVPFGRRLSLMSDNV